MYSKILREFIAEANITQTNLSEQCKKLNAPISRGRLNSILRDKAPAPSEKVSRTIAEICNCDERKLVLAGYLETAPHELIDYFNILQELLFNLSFEIIKDKIDKNSKEKFLDSYKKETITDFIISLLDSKTNTTLQNSILELKNSINGQTINFESPHIIMDDDSMESKIPKNSKLKISIPNKYYNGDIVWVQYNEKKYVRLAIFIGKNIFLYPFNSNYQSFYLSDKEYKILAKINSVEIKL